MKKFKKLLSIALCACMMVGMTTGASATKTTVSKQSDVLVSIEQLNTASEITFDEAVKLKMLNDNTSYELAETKLRAEESRIINELMLKHPLKYKGKLISQLKSELNRLGIIQYYNYVGRFTYAENNAYRGELNATIVIVKDTSTSRYIDRVDMISTRITAGTHTPEWVQTAVSSNIALGKKSVRLSATGYFKTTTTVAISVPGFSGSGAFAHYSSTVYPTFNYYV